nr:MAG TPA: hypothetical protein [Inoviridae sp.]
MVLVDALSHQRLNYSFFCGGRIGLYLSDCPRPVTRG